MVYFQQSLFGRTSWERFFQMTEWTLEPCSHRSQPPTFQCLLLENGQEPEWCEGIRPISHGEMCIRDRDTPSRNSTM